MTDEHDRDHEGDEEFERLGRRAGAEMRMPPPEGGEQLVQRSARHRRVATAIAAGGASAVILVVGLVVLNSSRSPGPTDESTPTTSLVVPPTDAPTPPPASGWIAFQAEMGAALDIVLVRRDGSDLHALAPDIPGGDQTNPDWSPDGQRLAFAATAEDGLVDVWTVDVDGSDAALLVDCADTCTALEEPAWSPDGASIAYTRLSEVDGAVVGTLEVIDLANSTVSVLATADPNHGFAGARWSPDGEQIVLEVVELAGPSLDSETLGVTLSVLDLGDPTPVFRPLTDPLLFAQKADWSPDGDVIVYGARPSAESEELDLFLIRPDGTGLTRLTELAADGASAKEPSFTSDGTEIVFVGEDGQLMSVPTDGGAIRSATGDEVVRGGHPRCQPVRALVPE